MAGGWGLKSYEDCVDLIESQDFTSKEGIYCNATWDGVLCWPATYAGETAELPCPPFIPLDHTKSASRLCDSNGTWTGVSLYPNFGRHGYQGLTNYSTCFTKMGMAMLLSFGVRIPLEEQKVHGFGALVLETVGLLLSLVSLVVSTFIFCYFRSIRSSHRIRIHRNLFVSVLIYTLVLLIKNIDQTIAVKYPGGFVPKGSSIWTTRLFCESLIILVEFTKSAMFSWMLIQGLHLQITLTHVFNVTPNYKLYYGIGWGAPVLITMPWAIINGLWNHEWCWFGYTYHKYFWAIEAPRFLILFVNLCFLVSVIRTLVSKLRSNRSPEKEQIKKSVKALLLLLPPLGANNLLFCVWPPNSSVALFALHLYASHFLSSIQGFLMALFFCFLNSEVKSALGQQWRRSRLSRLSVSSGHGSNLHKSQFTCLSEVGVEGRARLTSGRLSDVTNRTSLELYHQCRHGTIGTISSEDGFEENNF